MDKQQKIVAMFDDIAKTYDLANRIISFGADTAWRQRGCREAFALLGSVERPLIVDVATGTGDMIGVWHHEAARAGLRGIETVGIDPSVGMLTVARKKFPDTTFIEATATAIPLADESADLSSIAYGIRNVVERKKAWREFYRILRPGGLLVILEFTRANRAFLAPLARWYLQNILPWIGALVSRNYAAYKYLPKSIDEFLSTDEMAEELQEAGFEVVTAQNYSFGVCTLMIARKP
ncbi:MAG: bifunctional demethylmenaquinone methyltransferase/2-methoxy-6-polyprenyl-1,4-benzoquinol methylase UbiE [Campylobacterales bacterium]